MPNEKCDHYFPYLCLFTCILVYEELESTGKFERMSMKVDEDEHSIEMQLPYIAKVMQE